VHDHPFQNNIKQDHFWRVNAYLRQVDRKGNIPMRRQDGLMTLELWDNPGPQRDAEGLLREAQRRVPGSPPGVPAAGRGEARQKMYRRQGH